jgi:protein-S-isoprenylcysteine O-methyltransferase Ste14
MLPFVVAAVAFGTGTRPGALHGARAAGPLLLRSRAAAALHGTSPQVLDARTLVLAAAPPPGESAAGEVGWPLLRRGMRNLGEGEPGKRGEAYVGIQVAALVLVIFGDLPGLPLLRLLHLLLGPLCASSGTVLAALAAFRLGASLSPWPMPVAENELQTTGVYALLRHPMYVGILFFAVGCATMARSVPRIVVACALGLLLRAQSIVEERRMRERHGKAWDAYVASTPRFVPTALDRLPLDRIKRLWSGDRGESA